MKRIVLASIIISIAGCSSISLLRSFGAHPIVTASSQVGSNKQSVINAGGEPISKHKIINGKGECWDYTLNSGNEQTPFYVSFNSKNMTTHSGFITCAKADNDKLLVSEEPVRQIY